MVSPFPQHVRCALTADGVNLETTSSRFAGLKYRLTPYIACFLIFVFYSASSGYRLQLPRSGLSEI